MWCVLPVLCALVAIVTAQTTPEQCTFNPCYNGGTCVVNNGKYECVCSDGYSGETCFYEASTTTPLPTTAAPTTPTTAATTAAPANTAAPSQCSFNPCNNGGTCVVNPSNGKYECICSDEYTGETCFFEVSTTTSLPTSAAPTTPATAATIAASAITEAPFQCTFNPCYNGGTCVVNNGKYECICPVGYTGDSCFSPVTTPTPPPTSAAPTTPTTMAPTTTAAPTTTPAPALCGFNPCHNGGTCYVIGGVFDCSCPAGFTGVACYNQITTPGPAIQCEFNPCFNGATCVVSGNDYFCICPPGFHGDACYDADATTPPPQCSFNPCHNGGTCVVVGDVYDCDCPDGYEGVACYNAITTSTASPTTIV